MSIKKLSWKGIFTKSQPTFRGKIRMLKYITFKEKRKKKRKLSILFSEQIDLYHAQKVSETISFCQDCPEFTQNAQLIL